MRDNLYLIPLKNKDDTKFHPRHKPFSCGTAFLQELSRAVDDFKNERPVSERVSMDEIDMTVYDDWDVVGVAYYPGETVGVDIYAPRISTEGEDKTERLLSADEISGFTPLRGHEYRLKVLRFYLTEHPFYHYYELLAIMDDKQKSTTE